MPYLQLNDKQVQLRVGETRIGAGPEADIRIPGLLPASSGSVVAIAEFSRDGQVTVRRAAAASVVRVNAVQLGAEPTPLIHGDKIEIAGTELYYGDDRKGGSTQFISSTNLPDFNRMRGVVPARATATTGGRVISLVDGREYTVGPAGLVFGRDAGCDIVIPSSEVSRRHAEIVAGDTGYVLTDTSTNGLFVNGGRIEGMQILGRGDILRIGPEEFRFYADAVATAAAASAGVPAAGPAAPAPPRAPPPVPAAAAVAAAVPAPSTAPAAAPAAVPPPIPAGLPQPVASAAPAAPAPPPPVAASALAPVVPAPVVPAPVAAAPPPAMPAAPPSPAPALAPTAPAGVATPVMASAPAPAPAPAAAPAASPAPIPRGAIATLEVVGGGLLRGERYAVTMVLAHLGRGEHNDIVVPEESVSDSHAKLQRRDGIWYLTDLGSTNGTYVGGRRIEGEERLGSTADLRLGGVKLSFATSATEPATEPRGSTRQFSGISAADFAPRAGASRSSGGGRSSRPEPREPALPARTATGGTRGHRWLWLILLGAAVIAATLYFVQGR